MMQLEPQRVFYYFQKICSIPHGSGDMCKIASFCEDFAKQNSLEYVRDDFNNVVIYKKGTKGYEESQPVILQGHLDMVCQKEEGYDIDFLNDSIKAYVDGEFIKAQGTTLGADNGIAVAMVLAILESNNYAHPPIEAVFTTDEETGMDGALNIDMSLLKGKRMINIDSEEECNVTVSCAGGRNFAVNVTFERECVHSTEVTVNLKGLQGGHSGVEIHKGRVSANALAGRFLNRYILDSSVSLVSVNGGDKSNAITNSCEIKLAVKNPAEFLNTAKAYLDVIKKEISSREKGFYAEITVGAEAEINVIPEVLKKKLIFALVSSPQGVVSMSAEIEGLVETSMNLGILKTEENSILLNYSFRSNKKSSIDFLEEKMRTLFMDISCEISVFGSYPSWEYNANSALQKIYCDCYQKHNGKAPFIEAIHAGLECGVFDSKIDGLDCISIGPDMFDVHTFKERLSIASVQNIFAVLLDVLENLK